jgi:hypothetical protein
MNWTLVKQDAHTQVTVPYQLELLFKRSCTLAGRVLAGDLPFIDAVDMAYSAAAWAGVIDRYGDDVVQDVLATAFMEVPRGQQCTD